MSSLLCRSLAAHGIVDTGDALAHGENRPDPGEARGRVFAKAHGHHALTVI